MPYGSNFTNNNRGHLTVESQEGNLTGYLRHCCHVNIPIYIHSHNSEHGTWHYIHAVYFIYTFILPNYSSFHELYSVLHILKKVMYTENPFIFFSCTQHQSRMFTLTLKSKKRAIYYGFLKVERSQKLVFKLNFFSTPYLHRFIHSTMSA